MREIDEVVIEDGTGVTVERYWVDRDTGDRLEGGHFDCSGLVSDATLRGTWGRGVTRDRSALGGSLTGTELVRFFRVPGVDYGDGSEPELVEPEDDSFWTAEEPRPLEVAVTRVGEYDEVREPPPPPRFWRVGEAAEEPWSDEGDEPTGVMR